MENYYLKLLFKKVQELEAVLKSLDSDEVDSDYKKYLIAGYFITLSSILEVGIGDLHSEKFDDLASLIYFTRQKAVHYGYFGGLNDIEDSAQEILYLLSEENYKEEQDYYNNLLSFDREYEVNNVVVKFSSRITEDELFYKFQSQDEKKVLFIPKQNIFLLTKKNSDKVVSYIIDTSSSAILYSDGNSKVKEISGDETKQFFKENFLVENENYNEHNLVMYNIINSFISDPINSIQIMEFASDEQFCKNTIEIIKDYIFNKTMYYSYIDNNYLIKDKYSLNKMQKADYSKLLKDLKQNVHKYVDEKDIFFISMTIKRAKYFSKLFSDYDLDSNFKPEALSVALIQIFESGPKHFSNKLISSSPEFKKCYSNLLRYRQVFSHYLLTNKEYRDGVEKFKQEFINLIKVLQVLELNTVQTPMKPDVHPYVTIERSKNNFFNYKHEQFLKVDRNNYIGKKILYSSHNSQSKSLIAILQGGNHIANTTYYEKDKNGNLMPKYVYDERKGKKVLANALSIPLKKTKEVHADLSLSYLFKAFFLLKKASNKSCKLTINFHPLEENSNYAHRDDLEMVILRFFNQGYIPDELLQKIHLDHSQANKGFINLLNEKGDVVATVINEKKCAFKYSNYSVDEEDYFSRIDNIAHDFSKRRHNNVK